MSATPFYDSVKSLRFRGVPDTLAHKHVEGSECCLIHADNALSQNLGVWINPNVRVGYCISAMHKRKLKYDWDVFKQVCQIAYDSVHPAGSWVSHFQIARGLWENRVRRWFSLGWVQNRSAKRKLHAWRAEGDSNEEVGEMCLVDEMHVIEYVSHSLSAVSVSSRKALI